MKLLHSYPVVDQVNLGSGHQKVNRVYVIEHEGKVYAVRAENDDFSNLGNGSENPILSVTKLETVSFTSPGPVLDALKQL